MAMPTMAVYSASKFALEGASEAMWYELRPRGVHVSLVQPGGGQRRAAALPRSLREHGRLHRSDHEADLGHA